MVAADTSCNAVPTYLEGRYGSTRAHTARLEDADTMTSINRLGNHEAARVYHQQNADAARATGAPARPNEAEAAPARPQGRPDSVVISTDPGRVLSASITL